MRKKETTSWAKNYKKDKQLRTLIKLQIKNIIPKRYKNLPKWMKKEKFLLLSQLPVVILFGFFEQGNVFLEQDILY